MSCRDFISNLPDEILGKILSSLPTKLVVSTSLLSKRWRNLLFLVDNFDLEDSATTVFSDFLEKTVALLSTCPIKRLSLNGYYQVSTVGRWICTALKRGCLELHLQCQYGYPLDIGIFSSNTLIKLTLSGRIDLEGHVPPEGTVFFPALKTLSLVAVVANKALYEWLISGCPVLEELFIRDGCDDVHRPTRKRSVFSESVKRLTVFSHLQLRTLAFGDKGLIKTPNLEFLDYSGFEFQGYTLVDGLDSLVEARLDLRLSSIEYVLGDVTNLAKGIRNVKTLHLSPDSLEVLYFRCNHMPVFNNLLSLSFESDKEKAWHALPLLLNKFSMSAYSSYQSISSSTAFDKLIHNGLVHRVTNGCGYACACISKKEKGMCCLSACRIKVLEISGYRGRFRELKQMRHFLGKLQYLETVRIAVEKGVNKKYLRANLIRALHRASSECNIQFI